MNGNEYLLGRTKWLKAEKIRLQKELLKVEKELAQIELKIQKQGIDKSTKQ